MTRRNHGAKLQIWLSDSESAEWNTDEDFRATLKKQLAKRTLEKGRRFFEVFNSAGDSLAVGHV